MSETTEVTKLERPQTAVLVLLDETCSNDHGVVMSQPRVMDSAFVAKPWFGRGSRAEVLPASFTYVSPDYLVIPKDGSPAMRCHSLRDAAISCGWAGYTAAQVVLVRAE